jgi:hypothetical protein
MNRADVVGFDLSQSRWFRVRLTQTLKIRDERSVNLRRESRR